MVAGKLLVPYGPQAMVYSFSWSTFSEFASIVEIVERKREVRGGIACELDDQVNLRLEIDDQPAYDQLFWEFQVILK